MSSPITHKQPCNHLKMNGDMKIWGKTKLVLILQLSHKRSQNSITVGYEDYGLLIPIINVRL
jgi:hypothetical protein